MARTQIARERLRDRLVNEAIKRLEREGAGAIQARALTAAVGTSTQALYTYVGGMPGLFDAIVAEGFTRFAAHISAVELTDDPVADFFAQGNAYVEWALRHAELYRLLFGLPGSAAQARSVIRFAPGGRLADSPEGQAAVEVMTRSLARVQKAGRIRPMPPEAAAVQVLSATHGFVLLTLAGAFAEEVGGVAVMGSLAVNLFVGLGDERERAEESLGRAIARLDGAER
jgi:AcrR family transcriptional regulator